MDKNSLAALVERVEALTGPDREVDAAVWWHLVGCHEETSPRWRPALAADTAKALDSFVGPSVWRESGKMVPRYSASVDTVLSLVERKFPRSQHGIMREEDGSWLAGVIPAGEPDRKGFTAPTPALALLLALLKALTQETR